MKITCIDCGKARIVQPSVTKRQNYQGRCKNCAGKLNKNQFVKKPDSAYRFYDAMGYVMVHLEPDNFYFPMAWKNGYVKEHRLIMAQHLGRCLWEWEIVHHTNNIRDDNRLQNLTLETSGSHVGWHNSHGAYRGFLTKRDVGRM